MRSFAQSLVVLIFSVLTFSTYADEISPRYNVPRLNDCPAPERVTVTVTAPASGYSNPANTIPRQYPEPAPVSSKPNSIPSGYKSCFDRNRHSFTYSYNHGGYHFGVMEGGPKTGEPNTKGSWPDKPSSSGSPATSKASSGTTLATKVSFTAHYNSTSTSSYYGTTSNTPYYNTTSTPSQTTSTSSVLLTNSTVPSCQPDLQLDGVSEYGFNEKSVAFSVKIVSCSKFDVANTTAFANFAPVSSPAPSNPVSW
jgi:hypothetical protein